MARYVHFNFDSGAGLDLLLQLISAGRVLFYRLTTRKFCSAVITKQALFATRLTTSHSKYGARRDG